MICTIDLSLLLKLVINDLIRRLVEGITGEKTIYKKRGEEAPKPGGPHSLPKRLRFVLDVSASMYRFNKQVSIANNSFFLELTYFRAI